MTTRSAAHGTFCIERVFDAVPARVFKALSDPKAKVLWFRGPPEWTDEELTLDFRVGGKEISIGGPKGGPVIRYDGVILDIVPGERIITAYSMDIDGAPISASLATTELRAEGAGTRMIFTEQDVFLDGFEDGGGREHGTRELFETLAAVLATDAI